MLSQVEIQQLSTVAGSGSNQRRTPAMFNRRNPNMNDDGMPENQRSYNGGEEEGTGGDGGSYNQNAVSGVRTHEYQMFSDEGSNAPVVGGIINENFEEEKQAQRLNYQFEAVGGGHPYTEEDGD